MNKEELLRNLMPSQKIAYLKKKNQEEFEAITLPKARSSVSITPSMSLGGGPFKESEHV
jgi:hypothetical protein